VTATDNLQLTPKEIEDAYVWALAKKAKAAKEGRRRAPNHNRVAGSVGVRVETDEDGAAVERWYFTSHYGGESVTRYGGTTQAEAERSLMSHLRSVEARPRWVRTVERPSGPLVSRIDRDMAHLRFPYCPRCGNETRAPYVTYCVCTRCDWHEIPRTGWRLVTDTSGKKPTILLATVWGDVCGTGEGMWLGGFFSRLLGEPPIVRGCVTLMVWGRDVEYWDKGWDRAHRMLGFDDFPEPTHRFDLVEDVKRANARLAMMRSETPRPTVRGVPLSFRAFDCNQFGQYIGLDWLEHNQRRAPHIRFGWPK